MKTIYLVLFLSLISNILVNAQPGVNYTPYIQAGGVYYSSNRVTSTGIGPGIGLSVGINEHLLAKSDVNLYWINGNAGSFRLALGYKKSGIWAPAGYLGLTSLFGSRSEILLEDGSRPVIPLFSLGLQFSPLRFENEKGFVSLLEIGFGFGDCQGKILEVTLLSSGFKF